MTRGRRQGFVTKAELIDRLKQIPSCIEADLDNEAARSVLGHAIFYNQISPTELMETVERSETTLPCYLRTHVTDPEKQRIIERYVTAYSELFTRGSIIANLAIIEHFNAAQGPVSLDSTRDAIVSIMDFIDPKDARNSELKQVFLPERWPTKTVPRYG